jgi:hypothetical protein
MVAFDEKKQKQKISCKYTFNLGAKIRQSNLGLVERLPEAIPMLPFL